MKNVNVKGTIKTAFQTTLPYTLEYAGQCEVYVDAAEVKTANDVPNDEEILKFRNSQRINNARQKLMAERLEAEAKVFEAKNGKGVKNPFVAPTLETDENLRIKNIVDSLVAAGKSADEALVIAKAALGIS
jgi:hypothetical protein